MAKARGFFENVALRVANPELHAVENLLKTSPEFSKMREIAPTVPVKVSDENGPLLRTPEIKMVENLLKSTSFSEMIYILNSIKRPDSSVGKTALHCVMFLGGYVSAEFNFYYYATAFRDKVEIKRIELGFPMLPEQDMARKVYGL